MDTLGIRPNEAIYVGDTDVDIETAHNAGIKCIGVSWGFRGRKFLEDYKCDYIIDKPEELLPLIKSL
jgi:phosphoglycolate phosphatase